MSTKLLAPLAVALSLMLAACGGDTPSNTTAPPADSTPATPAPAPDVAPPAAPSN